VKTHPLPSQDIQSGRRQLVQGALRLLAVLGTLATAVSSYNAYARGDFALIPFYVGAYGVLLLLTFWKKVPYSAQAGTLICLIYGLGVLGLYESGLSGDGRVLLLVVPFMASVLFGPRLGVVMAILVLSTLGGFGWAFSTGRLTVPLEVQANTADPGSWVSGGLVFALLTSIIVVFSNYLVPRLADALQQSQELAQRLTLRGEQLQALLEERTADLERRVVQMRTAAQVAREAASLQDRERLLEEVVRLISERFGFYHAALFLLDPSREHVELRAASSPGGQRMLERGHRLRVGAGVVGFAAERGEVRIVRNVGEDAIYFDNPDLPKTRSEIALPLQTQTEIIGVLDVQSQREDAFSEEDVLVLQTLADQIALVISNVRLLEEIQERLEAERRAYGELSRAGWQAFLRGERELGFVRDRRGLRPLAEVGEASGDGRGEGETLAVPVRVRGQVIGYIHARKQPERGGWHEDERTLLRQLGEEMELALENARLYQETRRRAMQEQLVGEVTSQMRASLDLDEVLATAVQELGRRLALEEVVLQLVEEETLAQGG